MKFTAEQNGKTQEIAISKKPNEQKMIGSASIKRGHTLYSVNTKTSEIKKAVFETVIIDFVTKGIRKKVVLETDCIYRGALNIKNLKKQLSK